MYPQAYTVRTTKALRSHCSVTIHWIAGHADIPGNDEADALATLAAETSTSAANITSINSLIDNWEDYARSLHAPP